MERALTILASLVILQASALSAQTAPGTITTYAGIGFPSTPGDRNGNGRIDETEQRIFEDWGDGGPATLAGLGGVVAVAADSARNVYIATWVDGRIRRVGADSIIRDFVGKVPDPQPIMADGGFYFADLWSGEVGDGGPASAVQLSYPKAIAIGGGGIVYVLENGRSRIRRINPDGTISSLIQGITGEGLAAEGDGALYVCGSHRVAKVGQDGSFALFAGTGKGGFSGDGGPATEADLWNPSGLAVDSVGNVYIADSGNQRIRRIDTNGVIATVAGSGPTGQNAGSFSGDGGPATLAGLDDPSAVAVDGSGRIYIADSGSNRVRRVGIDGTITTLAGGANEPAGGGFSGDGGPASLASLSEPSDLALDPKGNLYIVDSGNNRIRRVESLELAPPRRAADFDGNGHVDFQDFLSFVRSYGRKQGETGFETRYDLSGDGTIDFADFIAFATDYGKSADG